MKKMLKDVNTKLYVVQLLFLEIEQIKKGIKEGEKYSSKAVTKKTTALHSHDALSKVTQELESKGILPNPKKYTLFFHNVVPITDKDICKILNLNPDVLHTNQ